MARNIWCFIGEEIKSFFYNIMYFGEESNIHDHKEVSSETTGLMVGNKYLWNKWCHRAPPPFGATTAENVKLVELTCMKITWASGTSFLIASTAASPFSGLLHAKMTSYLWSRASLTAALKPIPTKRNYHIITDASKWDILWKSSHCFSTLHHVQNSNFFFIPSCPLLRNDFFNCVNSVCINTPTSRLYTLDWFPPKNWTAFWRDRHVVQAAYFKFRWRFRPKKERTLSQLP